MKKKQVAITQQTLNQHLWKAVDILRGAIDSGAYKQYIFSLLFYKRLCDVWNERYEALLEHHNGAHEKVNLSDVWHIKIPFGCMWYEEQRFVPASDLEHATLRSHRTDVGARLNTLLQSIEDANPSLHDIFRNVDFSDNRRFSDALLNQLLDHFESLRLRQCDVHSDILGNAYEYLIKFFADDAGQKGGEFYTPKEVVQLLVNILNPKPNMTVYDPTCGSGGMLLECHRYIQKSFPEGSCTMFGQERNLNTWTMCRISLLLQDLDHSSIKRGDTIIEPQHVVDGALQTFDVILANPPFSLKNWGYKLWNKNGDRFHRDHFGIPPERYGDYAFIVHILKSLSERGSAGVVVPMGVLFRGGKEKEIRKNIIEADLIDTIVGLGPNLFFGATIPAAILFFKKSKATEQKKRIFFVNAELEFSSGSSQNYLNQSHIQKISETVREKKEKPLFSRQVDCEEIRGNDYNLNIIRYVQTTPPPPKINIEEVIERINKEKEHLEQEYEEMNKLLQGFTL